MSPVQHEAAGGWLISCPGSYIYSLLSSAKNSLWNCSLKKWADNCFLSVDFCGGKSPISASGFEWRAWFWFTIVHAALLVRITWKEPKFGLSPCACRFGTKQTCAFKPTQHLVIHCQIWSMEMFIFPHLSCFVFGGKGVDQSIHFGCFILAGRPAYTANFFVLFENPFNFSFWRLHYSCIMTCLK